MTKEGMHVNLRKKCEEKESTQKESQQRNSHCTVVSYRQGCEGMAEALWKMALEQMG